MQKTEQHWADAILERSNTAPPRPGAPSPTSEDYLRFIHFWVRLWSVLSLIGLTVVIAALLVGSTG